jgi:L-ascorbate metabolism protein UlaG (beta-lactamase superfamily)
VSHDHYDHLDFTTMRILRHVNVPIITSLGVGAHLEAFGIAPERIVELDWAETHRVPGTELTFSATPSQHFSGRGLKDGNKTLWSSWVIATQRHRVFFSGDTGLTPEYADTRARFGPFDLVMLEIGAFHPAWGNIHLGPENALAAHSLLGGGPLLPIHWGTFNLALHAWDDPVETLLRLAPKSNAQLLLPKLGEAIEPAQDLPVETWWRNVDTRPGVAPPVSDEMPREMPWPID